MSSQASPTTRSSTRRPRKQGGTMVMALAAASLLALLGLGGPKLQASPLQGACSESGATGQEPLTVSVAEPAPVTSVLTCGEPDRTP